ncbi:ribonuclease H-like domain-containing protein [Artemisia annua]|uniref:Ribonuclease H-like domain-containing protein n=1 Tax=Artemisia annua TaxID=35608 RepID=A0A2U1PA29_ARTAN|nr:ribonuclease H-like domain-containing protein [Artemisia annua]
MVTCEDGGAERRKDGDGDGDGDGDEDGDVLDLMDDDGNEGDENLKQIRTDNGTEFRNQDLECFCDEKGISQNFSSPYTPEQNGVAERKNRTLIEAARTMLNGSVLSKHFRTEAMMNERPLTNTPTAKKAKLEPMGIKEGLILNPEALCLDVDL